MPIYEYVCDACGQKTELIQKFSDAPLDKCPECGGTVTRPISQTNFVLKGGGWYKDLYSSTPKTSGETASSQSDSGSASSAATTTSGEKKSENKSATTTESKSDTKSAGTAASAPAPKKTCGV